MRLEVIEGPDRGKRMELNPGSHILIGRQDSNHLCLVDKKVSRVHAGLRVSPQGTVSLGDEKSSNGVYLGKQRIIAPVNIHPGEMFKLGDTVIILANSAIGPGTSEKSGIEFTPGEPHILGGAGEYQAVTPPTRSLVLGTESINIGRDQSNNVVLDHPMVSRFHARIISDPKQTLIYDRNSVNGTYVNGVRVVNCMALAANSMLQICGFRYIFDGHQLVEYDENSGQIQIQARNLGRSVKNAEGANQRLLEDINFLVQPRQFVAILGGSGAGKSTLMGVLSGMQPADEGEILLNGRDLYQEYPVFRSMIGYVPQEDIVHLELTVREVLTYSARLRMPDDTTENEIKTSVERVMRDLELGASQHVQVRNLSGGQRKRVSIGVELLTSPSMFFLDEPTSGLDPGLEKTMMEMMRRLADQGRTIILVTHATFNIKLCDRVVFLTQGGKLAFFGTPGEALQYFDAIDFADIYKKLDTTKSAEQWAKEYRQSNFCNAGQQNSVQPVKIHKGAGDGKSQQQPSRDRVRNSLFKQWSILINRYLTIMSRDRKNLSLLFLQPVIIAILIILVFFHTAPTFEKSRVSYQELTVYSKTMDSGQFEKTQKNNADESKRRSKMSMCIAMMVYTAIWLGTSNAAREIVKELPIYRRERRVNLKIAPYLLSKVSVLAVVCLIQTLIFLSLIDLALGLPNFWLNAWAFLMISLASVLMGLAVSSSVSNTDKAMSLVPMLLVPQIVLSGALIPMSSVSPKFLQGIFYLAISKWGYELVGGGICDINSLVALKMPPNDVLNGNFTGHWWILGGFVVVFYLVSTLAIKRKEH